MNGALGLDLGGTNMKAIVVNRQGNVINSRSIPTQASDGIANTTSRMAQLIRQLIEETPEIAISSAGVTAPAVINTHEGTIELMPNFPNEWKGVRLADELERLAAIPVRLLNDARAAAFGEKQFGAGRPFSDFVCITVGTGIGGGIVSGNQLLLGSRGVAGELGHLGVIPDGLLCGCGNQGCLETVSSAPAIAASAIRYILRGNQTMMRSMVNGDIRKLSAAIVCEAAEKGDHVALHVLNEAIQALVAAIRNLIVLLNPQAIILGGGVSESSFFLHLLEEKLRSANLLFSEELGGIQVVKAKYNVMAGAIGAAAWAMYQSEN